MVTSGHEDAIASASRLANDDYSSILIKALADRFAEALAEALHAPVRRDLGLCARRDVVAARN